MKNFLKRNWIIISILVFALLLRFWKLDSHPALNADEAAIGYNAYSLIKTGLDEHGNPWPIHFQSFNDFKPGLYFYMVVPFVKALGLNEWAVRLPGAILGVLTVLVVYHLVKELFPNLRKFSAPEIAALFLAISPWHIQFSRGGWEVNAATFFIVSGVWLFVRAIQRKFNVWNLVFSLMFFVLSLYTYHAARIIVPLLGVGLITIYWKEIFVRKNIKLLILSSSILIVLLIPLARDLFSSGALSRVAGVGLFADMGPINRINEQRGEHADFNSVGAKLIHNKAVNYGLAFAKNWAAHYHGLFLFLSGDDIQRNKVPETGQMYFFDILFIATGLIFIVRNYSLHAKSYTLVLYWLLIAPVAAALTFQAPHALRAQNMVIPLVIISAIGLTSLLNLISKFKNRKLLVLSSSILVVLVVWCFARYEHMYWVHMAKEYPFSSQYGVKELVSYISENQDKYQKIYVTDKYDQPYILFLFYSKYSPVKFQTENKLTPRDQFGFSTVRDYGKFHFESLNFAKILSDGSNMLIAVAPDEVPKGAEIIKRIYGSNGYEYFDIISN